jgi:phosphate starvation-inducible PhoH-like protein
MAKQRRTRRTKIQEGVEPTPKYQKTVEIRPRTAPQREYLAALNTFDTAVGIGSAGTGKSYIPLAVAARAYVEREIDQIILLRPLVAVDGKELGYFKGDVDEKMAPWAAAPLQNLRKILGPQKVDYMIRKEEIVARPLNYDRGMSYDRAFAVLDEAQNATMAELEMFLTRTGEGTRIAMTGDPRQSDLGPNPPFEELTTLWEQDNTDVGVVRFSSDDVVRSDACKKWVKFFERLRSDPLDTSPC